MPKGSVEYHITIVYRQLSHFQTFQGQASAKAHNWLLFSFLVQTDKALVHDGTSSWKRLVVNFWLDLTGQIRMFETDVFLHCAIG